MFAPGDLGCYVAAEHTFASDKETAMADTVLSGKKLQILDFI